MDHLRDPNLQVLRTWIKKTGQVPPDFVLETEQVSPHKLPLNGFLSPIDRAYPTHTPGHVWLSALYLQKQADDPRSQERFERLRKIAAMYDMEIPKWPQEKESEPIAAIKLIHDNDVVDVRPVRTAEDLRKIAGEIVEEPYRFTHDIRHNVASQCLYLGHKMGVDFGDYQEPLEKFALLGFVPVQSLKWAARDRKSHFSNPRLKHLLDKFDQTLSKLSGVLRGPEAQPAIRLVDAIDRLTMLHKRGVEPIELSVVQASPTEVRKVKNAGYVRLGKDWVHQNEILTPAAQFYLENVEKDGKVSRRMTVLALSAVSV